MNQVLYAINRSLFDSLFEESDLRKVEKHYRCAEGFPSDDVKKEDLLTVGGSTEVVVTSWGSPALDADVIEAMPNLKLLVHAAGTVKPFVSEAMWDAGVRVVSCAAAIAYGVAEYCLGLMLTECKRVFWAGNGVKAGQWLESADSYGNAFELYRQSVGIIGSGHVGRRLIELLKPFECRILLYDPYCSDSKAASMGVCKVDSLEEVFASSRIVSLNAPSTEETRGMVKGKHFAMLQDGALFINTARNMVIDEPEFTEELKKLRFIACLDVTDPVEPPPAEHPYRNLPNVLLTPHIAGAIANNRKRLGAFACEEIEAFAQGEPLKYEVKQQDLHRMA